MNCVTKEPLGALLELAQGAGELKAAAWAQQGSHNGHPLVAFSCHRVRTGMGPALEQAGNPLSSC